MVSAPVLDPDSPVPKGYKSFCYNSECYAFIAPCPYACGGCGRAFYCGIECQKKDWKAHKLYCCLDKNTQASHPHHEVARLELQALSLTLEEELFISIRSALRAGTDESLVQTHFLAVDFAYVPSEQMCSNSWEDAGELRKKFNMLGAALLANDDEIYVDLVLKTKSLTIQPKLFAGTAATLPRPVGSSGNAMSLCRIQAWIGGSPSSPGSTTPLPFGSSLQGINVYYDQTHIYAFLRMLSQEDPDPLWPWERFLKYNYTTYAERQQGARGMGTRGYLSRLLKLASQGNVWLAFESTTRKPLAQGSWRDLLQLYPDANFYDKVVYKAQILVRPIARECVQHEMVGNKTNEEEVEEGSQLQVADS